MADVARLPSSAGPSWRLGHDELVALEVPLRRFVRSRVGSDDRADDIVQETLLRTLEAADSLEIETLTAYAIVVARNQIVSHARADATARRHLARLVDTREPGRPEDIVSAEESREALAAALAALPPRSRLVLMAHDMHDQPLAELAQEERVAPGALAAQLHRTRARLRVDYVIALRRAELPTPRCRSVLMAISARDRRQQRAHDVGHHLTTCPVCDELAVPLLARDRTLAGFLPWLALGGPQGAVEGWIRRYPRVSSLAALLTALMVGALVAVAVSAAHTRSSVDTTNAASVDSDASTPSTSPPPVSPSTGPSTSSVPPAVPNLVSSGGPVVAARGQLGADASAPVDASKVAVLAVPGDEGFWVGDDSARIWVQMTGGQESSLTVTVGMRMSFHGTLVPNSSTFVKDQALTRAEDQQALDAMGVHVELKATDITIEP
jgi:RNA polymerase sigma factor (sigma-70 family)